MSKKKQEKKAKIDIDRTDTKLSMVDNIVLYILLVILLITPFFRGLFFPEDQHVALLGVIAIFITQVIVNTIKGKNPFIVDNLQYPILGLITAYLFSTFSAANYNLAINSFLVNVMYFMLFYIVWVLIKSQKQIEQILQTIYITGIAVSIAGLLIASKTINVLEGFTASQGGAIASVFQYKNALASYLMVAFLVGLYFWSEKENNKTKRVFSIGNFLLITTFLLTNSNGGFIIACLMLFAYIFLTIQEKRAFIIIYQVLMVLIAGITSKLVMPYILANKFQIMWLSILIGLIFALAINEIIARIPLKKVTPRLTNKNLAKLATVVGVVILAILKYTGVFHALTLKLHMHGALERITMYQDGFKMIMERPLLGWGGGGWQEGYTAFQSYGYVAKQVHSYFLQIAIETGILGLIAVIAIWSIFIYKLYQIFKQNRNNLQTRPLIATLACSTLAIIIHAQIDFNLSLTALTLVLFTLMACVVKAGIMDKEREENDGFQPQKGHKLVAPVMVLIIVGLLLIADTSIILSNSDKKLSIKLIRAGNIDQANNQINQAISSNPLDAESYIILSNIESSTGKPDLAIVNAKKAIALEPYNSSGYIELSKDYLQYQKHKEALTAANEAVRLAPLDISTYDNLSDVTTVAAVNELKKNNPNEAKAWLDKLFQIPNKIAAKENAIDPNKEKLWINPPFLKITNRIQFNLGIANLLTSKYNLAKPNFEQVVSDSQLSKDVMLWQAVLAHKQGQEVLANSILKQAQKTNANIKTQYNQLKDIKVIQ